MFRDSLLSFSGGYWLDGLVEAGDLGSQLLSDVKRKRFIKI